MAKRIYRKRRKSSGSSSDIEPSELPKKVCDIKDIQKGRARPSGINAVSLAVGRIVSQEEALSGNVVGHSTNKQCEKSEERYGLQVGNTFSAESNQKEEDHIMHRYIENKLAQRRGVKSSSEVEDQYQQRINELFKVPDHLQTHNVSLTEDMLSDQVLTGIPEVDLGLSTKIQNIEKTDQALNSLSSSKPVDSSSQEIEETVPRNYTHDYARLDKINHSKAALNILKDDRYV